MSVHDGADTTKAFGTNLQQFAQRLSAALARFNINVTLSDSNFTDWSPVIMESLQTLCLNQYLTNLAYDKENMTMARHEKLKEILTTWMLSHMDVDNARRSRSHLTTYSSGMMTVSYDPHSLWSFVNSYHCSITEGRLTVITTTLHSLRQGSTDSLTSHLNKFNLVLNEFYKFSGEMSETQATRLLINTLRPEYDTVVKMIFMTVKELTLPKVSALLLESEVQSGGWANSAVYRLSSAAASTSSSQPQRRAKCTQSVCVGPHDRSECFELPQNSEKKAAWIAKQEAGQAARSRARPTNDSVVRGIRTVNAPTSSTASMPSFYTSLDVVTIQSETIEASPAVSVSDTSGRWALLDTGASHHMFNDESLFVATTIKPHNNPSQRLKLAGGGVSLAVKATGVVQLKAGDGTVFSLNNCLLVPELAKNLISGGALFKSRAMPVVHDGHDNNFSVVKDNLAVFNGAFVGNLMVVSLDTVSTSFDVNCVTTSANYSSCGSLQHQRLGHASERTVKQMSRNGVALDMSPSVAVQCDICPLSNSTKQPHSDS